MNNRLFAHQAQRANSERAEKPVPIVTQKLQTKECKSRNRKRDRHCNQRQAQGLLSRCSLCRAKPWRQREAPLFRLLTHTPVLFNEKENQDTNSPLTHLHNKNLLLLKKIEIISFFFFLKHNSKLDLTSSFFCRASGKKLSPHSIIPKCPNCVNLHYKVARIGHV